jgi:hypothetical protein
MGAEIIYSIEITWVDMPTAQPGEQLASKVWSSISKFVEE